MIAQLSLPPPLFEYQFQNGTAKLGYHDLRKLKNNFKMLSFINL